MGNLFLSVYLKIKFNLRTSLRFQTLSLTRYWCTSEQRVILLTLGFLQWLGPRLLVAKGIYMNKTWSLSQFGVGIWLRGSTAGGDTCWVQAPASAPCSTPGNCLPPSTWETWTEFTSWLLVAASARPSHCTLSTVDKGMRVPGLALRQRDSPSLSLLHLPLSIEL